jgi:CHAT domain
MKIGNKILFVASNPTDMTYQINANEEYETIQNIIKSRNKKLQYTVEPYFGITPEKLFKNHAHSKDISIFHFSGHGNKKGLVLENLNGEAFCISAENIVQFVATLPELKCVLLSACNSANTAKLIGKYVDFAIGFNCVITNEQAITFFKSFYESLNKFETFFFAYMETCRELDFMGVDQNESFFYSKRTYILEFLNTGNSELLRQNGLISEGLLADIAYIEAEKEKLQVELSDLNKIDELDGDLLINSPFPKEILWFFEKKETLAASIAAKFISGDIDKEKEFNSDLMIIFFYLESILITVDYREMKENTFKKYKLKAVTKKKYREAMDSIIDYIPEYANAGFKAYALDAIKYIKSFL